jgi:hypothetical protein
MTCYLSDCLIKGKNIFLNKRRFLGTTFTFMCSLKEVLK